MVITRTTGCATGRWRLVSADEPSLPVQSSPLPRLTDAYVREIGRIAYLWAWPMVNLHNRFEAFAKVPEPGLGV